MTDKMNGLSTEFAGLLIILSDYDAIFAASLDRAAFSPVNSNSRAAELHSATSPTSPSSPSSLSDTTASTTQKWETGFSDYADHVWKRKTTSLKQKLRDACVEVLKRTQDASEGEKVGYVNDEDARFLE